MTFAKNGEKRKLRSRLPASDAFYLRAGASPFLILAVASRDLPLDYGLQPVAIVFAERRELKWLPVPRHRRQHLGIPDNAAFGRKKHQFADCSGLYRPLQTEQASGHRDNFQLR